MAGREVHFTPSRTAVVNRRAPELALLSGLLLALPVAGFALWATGEFTPSLLTGVVLCYPFVLYAVVHDDDPTTALPARAVGLVGGLLGLLLVLDAFATAPSLVGLLRGGFLGLLVALPPAAYAVAYGDSGSATPVPARPVFAGTLAVGLLLVVAGVVAGTAFGAASGGLVALAGGLYARARGYRPSRETRLGGVAAGVLLGAALVVLGLTREGAEPSSMLAAAGVVLAPGVYYALTVQTTSFD